ncbi:MAG TPA: class I adenylate-forming enzyme family protein [Sedimentisphaerales bacterium]|nr:class I adenylate-forming enzyme family protein [Sedimentisphaerales bacterium]
MKIIDLLANSAAVEPRRAAMKSGGIEVSYERMLSDVCSLAGKLKSAGCSRGVNVGIVLDNSVEYLISFFAISAAGGTILPLSAHMTAYEVAGFVDGADISILITGEMPVARQSLDKLAGFKKVTIVRVRYDNKNLEVDTSILGNCAADEQNADVALMVPTSGTTGPPKIVMLTDRQLISNMIVYRSLMGFEAHNVVYCALSFHHIYCICAQILTHASLADTFLISDKPFFIRDFLKAVEANNVTVAAFVPYMAVLMAAFPKPQMFNLRSLRHITLSGAKTPKSTYRLLTEKYKGIQFINTYGMSEAGSRISIAAPSPNGFPIESVGRPMPSVSVKIVDDSGITLPPNCRGEIMVRSSGVMKGYYKQHDLTAKTIINGWLKTGDLGRLDDDGNLFILGRTKDIIISGGENICPFEIEECLIEHPAIREAAVVAQRDKLLQEVPCAFVVKKDTSVQASPVDILKFCKTRLSTHKVPRAIKFLEKLPKLGTSKVDRNALKQMANKLP